MRIELTNDFKKETRKLIKKYKNFNIDLKKLFDSLLVSPNKWTDLWDWFYKIRIKNSDNNKWKSWWYRTITYYNEWDFILLITIYSKSDTSTISKNKAQEILRNFHSK